MAKVELRMVAENGESTPMVAEAAATVLSSVASSLTCSLWTRFATDDRMLNIR